MKLCITGANGFVGRSLCERASTLGYSLAKVVRNKHFPDEIMVGNIDPSTDWSAALEGCDVVVHLAAKVHVMSDPSLDPLSEFRSLNVHGTLNLARQAAQAGVRRLVFLSSIKVNGESTKKGVPFMADDNPAPEDAYAISKYEAEQGLMSLSETTGMEVVIIRPPLVYGPGVKANFQSMMKWLNRGIPLPLGAIHNTRSLVSLDNLVSLIMTCLTHPRAANQVFLVSDGQDLSTTELLTRTAAALGRPARLIPVPEQVLEWGARLLGKGDMVRRLCGNLQVDISKTREMLDWEPPVDIDEGLRRTASAWNEKTV